MGSNQKQTRRQQKESFERSIEKRKALLTEKGLDEQSIKKDKVLKHFQAELKRSIQAIASIEATEKTVADARAQKQKNIEAKAAAGPKKKKKEEPKKEGGGKKKKKKKE